MNTAKRNGEKEMSKNLIPEIARMLGIAIGEEFKIRGDDRTCFIDLDGLHLDYNLADDEDNAMLHDLLCGDAEIIKLPYRPDYRQMYWTFGLKDGIWVVVPREWEDYPAEILLADKGWTYRSKEEAEDALPKVAAEMGVQYVL